MAYRTITGALALMLLASPLAAALCAGCVPSACARMVEPAVEASHCMMAKASAAVEPVTVAAATVDCCATVRASTPAPSTLTPPVAGGVDIAPLPSLVSRAPMPVPARCEDARGAPPRPAPPPLYTLHSALLI